MMYSLREIKQRRAIERLMRENCPNLARLVDRQTCCKIGAYSLALIFRDPLRWRRRTSALYVAKTPNGELRVGKYLGGWAVMRDSDASYEDLVHTDDGRTAVFTTRDNAQAAAELHANEGEGACSKIPDDLCWKIDD